MSTRKKKLVQSKSKQQQSQKNNGDNKQPPAAIIREKVNNVKYKYHFLKTVHSLEELDNFRFQNSCDFWNVKRNNAFTRAKLDCTNRRRDRGLCQFSLMARRSHPKSTAIHVYANSEHNHPLKPQAERAAHKMPKKELVSDADPPTNFTTPDGHQWTLLSTAKDQRKVEKFRLKHHCKSQKGGYKYNRTTMHCTSSNKCKFRLLALKTDCGRYHMYASGQHTCRHADNKNAAGTKSVIASDDKELELEEIQAMEEEENERVETAENACPSTSSTGDIEEQQEEWPTEKIQRRLTKALREESADRVDKWMARTNPNFIGEVLAGMDIEEVVKLLEMARKELRGASDKKSVTIWLDWIEASISFRGSELAKIPNLVNGLLSRILKRIERRELLPKRRLRIFRKLMAAMREHMQRVADLGIFA